MTKKKTNRSIIKNIMSRPERLTKVMAVVVILLIATVGVNALTASHAATQPPIAITTVTGMSLSADRGTFGPATKLASLGYKKMSVSDVAAAASYKTDSCSLGSSVSGSVSFNSSAACKDEDSFWQQQGITGVGGSGYANRNDIILVSWYGDAGDDNTDNDTRARITIQNNTTKKYIYADLVKPDDSDDGFQWLADAGNQPPCWTTHAGGISWYKNTLIMADDECLIMFDLNSFYKKPTGRIVLPVTHYFHRNSGDFKYSAAGLDMSGSVPQLLVAQSNSGDSNDAPCKATLITRWDLDPQTGTVKLDSGSTVRASADKILSESSVCRVQGLAYKDNMYLLSTFSKSSDRDYVYRLRTSISANADTKFKMPYQNNEGIYLDPTSNTMWGLTELPGDDGNTRVFSWKTSSMLD